MPVELSELMQLVAGRKRSLPVGDLPRVVAEHLRCHPAIVYLGHKEVLKIVRKHGEIRVEELQCLPFALCNGEYRADPDRGDCATVFYQNPETEGIYLVGVKACERGGEVWIQTFFKIGAKKAERRRARMTLLRGRLRKG